MLYREEVVGKVQHKKLGKRRPCQKILITFKDFVLWNSIKIVLNLGKMSKWVGGLGVPKILEYFSWTFDHIRLFKNA